MYLLVLLGHVFELLRRSVGIVGVGVARIIAAATTTRSGAGTRRAARSHAAAVKGVCPGHGRRGLGGGTVVLLLLLLRLLLSSLRAAKVTSVSCSSCSKSAADVVQHRPLVGKIVKAVHEVGGEVVDEIVEVALVKALVHKVLEIEALQGLVLHTGVLRLHFSFTLELTLHF